MRAFVTTTVLSLYFLTISGCDQLTAKHEIVRAGDQTLLVETRSGNVKIIKDSQMMLVKEMVEAPGDDPAKQAKVWPDEKIPQLGEVTLSIRTKYRDGKMLYMVQATPFVGKLGEAYASTTKGFVAQPMFYLDFFDADGFPSGESIDLDIRGSTRIVNAKGEPQGFSWTGSAAMSLEAYRDAAMTSVRWGGFD